MPTRRCWWVVELASGSSRQRLPQRPTSAAFGRRGATQVALAFEEFDVPCEVAHLQDRPVRQEGGKHRSVKVTTDTSGGIKKPRPLVRKQPRRPGTIDVIYGLRQTRPGNRLQEAAVIEKALVF